MHEPLHSRTIGLLFIGLLLLTCGCQKKSVFAQAAAPTIDNFTVEIHSSSAVVGFDVVDPAARTWDAWLYYSDDLGQQWHSVTPVSGNDGIISLTPPFESVQTEWSFRGDLTTLPQADILLEVRLLDLDDHVHAFRRSDPLSIGEGSPPIVDSVTIPTGAVGGPIPVNSLISDADGDFLTVHLEWSLDGSEPWNIATLETGVELVIPGDKGISQVEMIWNSHIDTPGVVSPFARVRVVASDASGSSTAVSPYIALNTIAPIVNSITIGEIPPYLNGSEPYIDNNSSTIPFTLSIPAIGTLIQVNWSAGAGGAAADAQTLSIVANLPLANRDSNTNLADLFTIDGSSASWQVSAAQSLPTGTLTITAVIDDVRGNPSEAQQYQLHVHPASTASLPFDWQDRWNLDFSRDNYSIGWHLDSVGDLVPFANTGADGSADHQQDLVTIGLQSNQPTTAAVAAGCDLRVQFWVEQSILERIQYLYGEGSLLDGQDLQPQLKFQVSPVNSTSALGIGGDDVDGNSYALGRATFDFRNSNTNDERAPNRGVFTSNMVQFYWNSWTFRNRFEEVLPGLGVAVGEHPIDAVVLGENFERLDPTNSSAENQRYDGVWNAIDAWSRIVAVVAAHEVGHAVGLCANGAPPSGLFGGVSSADFTGPFTTAYHVDTPGLNVMSSALGLTSALVEGESGYRFNELNEAYIAEWTTLEP
ncbi:MAG: hypothetical protein OSB12_02485 [Planctomycetota bacterium]|nr:hypothetical protein [Planctomycetota bacterium]